MKSLLVCELYRCLQGEGVSLGTPSVLVRFQGCNLRCSWCDSAFTQPVLPKDPSASVRHLTPTDLMHEIKLCGEKTGNEKIRHVIYTGGEPTLQPFHRVHKLLGSRWTAEVETNGTTIPHKIFRDFATSDYSRFQWNVSPKGEIAGHKIRPDALAFWSRISKKHRKIHFKFVVRRTSAKEDLQSILALAESLEIPHDRILLMGEGTERESQTGASWLAEICQDNNLRYTPRLHVVLYGSMRGV